MSGRGQIIVVMPSRQLWRSAFALLGAFSLLISPVMTGVARAVDPPVAVISAPPIGTTNVAVAFDGSGSTDDLNDIVSYEWDFGDSGTATGTTPSHTYLAPGPYTVTLTVTDGEGLLGAATHLIGITDPPNVPPSANPGGPYSGTAGVSIAFDGSGSFDSDGTIVSYAWNFGDSGTATGATPSHTYLAPGTYTVTLTVTDDDGATDNTPTTTATTVYAQPTNQPPVVAVTAPSNGAVITGPFTVRIRATDQEDAPGTLSVSFRFDATGVWRTASYNTSTLRYEATVDTTVLANGTHSITARATDRSSVTSTSSSVTFILDTNQAPTVRISGPIVNALVSGSITISATATDSGGVSRVEFFVDGSIIGVDTSSAGGWNVRWDTTTTTRGRHVLTATATDVPGKTGASAPVSVTVDQLPTVDITAPRAGTVIEERVSITAPAADDAGIAKVEFFVDGSIIGTDTSATGGWRISWDTRRVNNGRHTLRATATDTSGQATSDSVLVTVDNDLAPRITITGPGDGTTMYGIGTVLISANASDDDEVEQVEFFVDGASIGVDTIAVNGWSALWNPTRATIGSHTIQAVATDSIGQTATDSNEVTIQALTTASTSPPPPTSAPTTMEVETLAQGISVTAFSTEPPTASVGAEIALSVTVVARSPGSAAVLFLLDGQPLGETATLNVLQASVDAVFTRTVPAGIQSGYHVVEVVTTQQPRQVLASRSIGVVAGDRTASNDPDPAAHELSTQPLLIVAIFVGAVAALAAAGFGFTGWYRRKTIVRRLSVRER